MFSSRSGIRRSTLSAVSWLPWTGWTFHTPVTVMPSPAAAQGIQPTTVTGSSSPSTVSSSTV